MKKLLLPLFISSFFSLLANPQKEMIHELQVVKHLFETKYGPLHWKKEHLGWNLEKNYQTARNKILMGGAGDIKSFQKIFKEFIRSTNDYHVNVAFCSTGTSWFPINTVATQGRFFIGKDAPDKPFEFNVFKSDPVNLEKYLPTIMNLKPGDEILAIDGKPILTIIESLIDENIGGNRSPTSYAMAAKMLFKRKSTPARTFNLTIQHEGEEHPVIYSLPWLKIPEWIPDQPISVKQPPALPLDCDMSLFSQKDTKKMQPEIYKLLAQEFSIKESHPLLFETEEEKQIDTRNKGKLPPLGEVLWESALESGLYAYLYQNAEGRKIGYLFIESFEPVNAEGIVEELINMVTLFNEESDALIVDITDNPGGSAMFGYGILSTLTSKPLICPTQRETLIQEDLFGYIAIQQFISSFFDEKNEEGSSEKPGRTLFGYTLTEHVVQEMQNYVLDLLNTWDSGRRFTDPHHLLGISQIAPHPKAHYEKPILLLINELAFSCADIFAAIMKDNNRAVLFGKQTAGAGGYVRKYKHTSRFGITGYTLTGSILIRPNGKVIENLGVAPDVPYEISLRDVREDYADYAEAVNNEINKLI